MSLDDYIAGIVKHLRTPADAVNENELYEWCFQRWYSKPRPAALAETTLREHAADYDKYVHDGFGMPGSSGRSDRHRKGHSRVSP